MTTEAQSYCTLPIYIWGWGGGSDQHLPDPSNPTLPLSSVEGNETNIANIKINNITGYHRINYTGHNICTEILKLVYNINLKFPKVNKTIT